MKSPRVFLAAHLVFCVAVAGRALPGEIAPRTIDGALKQLNIAAQRSQGTYSFLLRDQPVLLRPGPKWKIVTKYAGELSAEALTKYNDQQAVCAVAHISAERDLVLEAEFNGNGATEVQVRKFLICFGRDLQEFETLLQKRRPAELPLAFAGKDQKSFQVTFPINDLNWETAWRIDWDMETIGQARKAGIAFPDSREADAVVLFKIKKAFFKPGKKAPWVQVLEDAHPSELYVPYYFRNTRFFDLRDAGNYVTLNASEGGPRGNTLGADRLVMAEVRDRGVAYKNGDVSRRAEELALWANFNAGNYTYLIEFGFMDDGTIAFRHAPTGYNLPSDHFANHMHNCCWRIGMNLGLEGKPATHQVAVAKWPGGTPVAPAANLDKPNFGVEPIKSEGFRDWEPKEFTKIRVSNPNVILNEPGGANARPIAYDIVPLVQGIARHPRPDESFTKHDFWITRADSPVKQYIHLGDYFTKAKPRPLDGSGVVLWHMSSALHVPRSEDGILKGSSITNGQALATWTIVELRPRNLFSATPIYRGR